MKQISYLPLEIAQFSTVSYYAGCALVAGVPAYGQGLERMIIEVRSNLDHSVVLCILEEEPRS